MSKQNDGGPAYPQGHPEMCKDGQSVDETQGMRLRDYFAGQALAGLLASGHFTERPDQNGAWMTRHLDEDEETGMQIFVFDFAEAAWRSADAMLEARDQ